MLSDTVFLDKEGVFTANFEDGKVYNLDNIFIDLNILPESDVLDDTSETEVVSMGEAVTVTDTVRYNHLKITQTYKIVTEIYWEDAEGNITKIGEGEKTFQPQKVDNTNTANGTVDVTVTLDTTKINGGKLHAVDKFYLIDGENEVYLLTHNADMDDERQMLFVPALGTTAVNKAINLHLAPADGILEITDTVIYETLPNNRTFIVEGTLRDAATGEVITGSDGQPCVVSKQLGYAHDVLVVLGLAEH